MITLHDSTSIFKTPSLSTGLRLGVRARLPSYAQAFIFLTELYSNYPNNKNLPMCNNDYYNEEHMARLGFIHSSVYLRTSILSRNKYLNTANWIPQISGYYPHWLLPELFFNYFPYFPIPTLLFKLWGHGIWELISIWDKSNMLPGSRLNELITYGHA